MPSSTKPKSFWTRTPQGDEVQVFIYDHSADLDRDPDVPEAQMLTEDGEEVIQRGEDLVVAARGNMILTRL